MLSTLAPSLLLSFAAQSDASTDWPQYLGPDRTGVAPWPAETFEWPEDGPKVEWRVATGPGFGGVAVQGGEVFLFDRDKGEGDVLRVFDLDSGEELWSAGYAQPGRLSFDGSRTVPTVVGRRVYTASGFGPVSCFDRDAKELVWTVDIEEELGGSMPMFGWCAHPYVVGDLVIVTPLGPDVGVVALDAVTGEIVWSTGRVGFSHSVPVLLTLNGKEQLIFNTCPKSGSGSDAAAPGTVWSIDPETGDTLWKHELLFCRLPIVPPVVVDDERLFLTGGYRAGSAMLRVRPDGEGGVDITEEFRSTRGSQTHVPILYEDHLYVLVNENWTDNRRRRAEGGFTCFDLEGNERWRTGEDPNFGRGGLVQVADAFLVQDGYKGTLVAVRATPEEYTELGRFDPFEIRQRDGQLWAPPAVSGTRVLMRSQDELVCVQLAP